MSFPVFLKMILSLLYTVLYAVCGTVLARSVFYRESCGKQLWLGLVLGLFGMTWMPSLFSFLSGSFSVASHALGTALFAALALLSVILKKRHRLLSPSFAAGELKPLLFLVPLLLIGCVLFDTHILKELNDGLYVGQTTYGDLAMHLGFISSIAVQGTFPPDYSIFPGHTVNYPFLCEVPASSLYLLGAPLRAAYLISALYAYLLVVLGVYFLLQGWLKKPNRALLGAYLFFIGGGFGFAYFLDGLNSVSTVADTLNSAFSTNLAQILEGYYTTPTNLPDLGLRWVNPIVDMLIPQRATLFGWAFLFPCLYLLHGLTFEDKRHFSLPLGILAGGLPLIHTHSFLSLGIISAVYCLSDLFRSFSKKSLTRWLLYGGVAVILAAPQLFGFTFRQVSESSMVQLHFNWANEKDSYFWFYLKNWGVLFLLLLPGMLFLSKRDRQIMAGPLLLWFISETVIFQPNQYDNNKLIFVFFAYLCGLSAKFICVCCHKLRRRFSGTQPWAAALPRLLRATGLFLLFLTVFPCITSVSGGSFFLKQGQLASLLLLFFIGLLLSCKQLYYRKQQSGFDFPSVLSAVLFLAGTGLISWLILDNTDSVSVSIAPACVVLLLALEIIISVLSFMQGRQAALKNAGSYAFFCLSGAVLPLLLFLSGGLTVAREWNSSYQVFSNADVASAEFIKSETEPDAVFLTDYSWHLNAVSVLTGRSIVCGPDLFLYYHGIDTEERKADVAEMFENPAQSTALFAAYNVSYVYIGSNERYRFNIDTEYFYTNADCIYDAGGILIFRLNTEA